MADVFSTAKRSSIMSNVRDKNTRPEVIVRSALHRQGYRFRLHRRDLPGTPDIVLPKHRTVIFVNGCFWHQHKGCAQARRPKSNHAFWAAKLDRNVARDRKNCTDLKRLGWRTVVIWTCQTATPVGIMARLGREFTND